jgi:hypothetical protein
MGTENGDVKAAIDAVERLATSEMIALTRGSKDSAPAVVLPAGKKLHSIKPLLDEYRLVPERKKGTTTLTTLEDLCEFVNRQKTAHSIVFIDDVNPKEPVVRSIFNPHHAEADSKPDADIGPDWADHCAVYKFPLSPEWIAWTTLPPHFSQGDFAAFLEDRITDVVIAKEDGTVAQFAKELGVQLATPARLIELSKNIAITVDAKFEQKLNTSTGEGLLAHHEEHKDTAGAPIKVPGAFAISIPVFRLGGHFQVPVRLRYRLLQNRSVAWMLSPQRLDKVFELALQDAHQTIAARCQVPVFRGAP